ncbi:MAG: type II secretion system protein GspG [Sandaracinaceae bacterium]
MTYRRLDSETRDQRVRSLLEARRELSLHLRAIRWVLLGRRAWVWLRRAMVGSVVLAVLLLLLLVGSTVCPPGCHSDLRDTVAGAASVRSAVEMYVADNPGADCPAMEDLLDGYINSSTRRTADAWDQDYVIECEGDDIGVSSVGRDGQCGTEDDITTGGTRPRCGQ